MTNRISLQYVLRMKVFIFANLMYNLIINVKKIAFGNKECATDKKIGVSILLRLFISSNEISHYENMPIQNFTSKN